MSATPPPATPFPTLTLDFVPRVWNWPQPSFARCLNLCPLTGDEQACRIETTSGTAVEGQLLDFDADAALLHLRMRPDGKSLAVPFAKFHRLTLMAVASAQQHAPGVPAEAAPSDAQERGYRIDLAAGGHLSGRTLGYWRCAAGVFLFEPQGEGRGARRVFVPQAASTALHFGKSAQEQAAERWIATPQALLAALDAQQGMPIKPLGEALVALGFMGRAAIERAVQTVPGEGEQPLGERLVAAGLLERADLQTALAHKMGLPLVDLARFPIEKQAARKLSQRSMAEHHAVALMQHGERLIVAIDDLACVPRLQALQCVAGLTVVPVLASRGQIALALAALPQRVGDDRWADNVPLHLTPNTTQPGSLHAR